MLELNPSQYPQLVDLFHGTHFGVLAFGTLDGGHPGRVFADRPDQPGVGLICTRVGYYFLAGRPSPAVLDWLFQAFTQDFVPHQKAEMHNPEVLLFYEPGDWQPLLFERFAACRPIPIYKKRFTLPEAAHPELPTLLPEGMRVVPYTEEILDAYPELAEEARLFYGSTVDFLDKSLGCCVLHGDTLASACHAVFTCCNEAEISIFTRPEYRRQGLAQAAARGFIRGCRERGLQPIWGCWPENEASVGLAKRLGFVEAVNQPVCLWVDEPDWNP